MISGIHLNKIAISSFTFFFFPPPPPPPLLFSLLFSHIMNGKPKQKEMQSNSDKQSAFISDYGCWSDNNAIYDKLLFTVDFFSEAMTV